MDHIIKNFIEEKIINYEISILPHNYPKGIENGFDFFQDGYRYNGVTKESFVGKSWEEDLYVICSNYYSDPYVINIREKDDGYPVYYCEHGSGKWAFRKVFNSIETFLNFIKSVPRYDIETEDINYNKVLEFLRSYPQKNSLIEECIEEVEETINLDEG
ncbi:SMI1/KNR4 family protein [Flammeovirga sp. SJP92]|uniref:SMI1/KNR4 family protein n=1 Tax=Flammeovirga sp. SJP92 TaxID=1775430 RepID=UPI000787A978|nr:SMI1/KNR4 family protein [Flammeovirga sp. SJP92]KXX70474.1 hypothetical protein AVL50_08940 [Flammeovirga sp. SJP92]